MTQTERGPESPEDLRAVVHHHARDLGFHRIGVTSVDPPQRFNLYRDWLAAGQHGSMAYMAAPEHIAGRANVRSLAQTAKSVVVVALSYSDGGDSEHAGDALHGHIARYARGRDYHVVIKTKLRVLAQRLTSSLGRPVAARACVDSAPVLERDLAERAGVGFVGKNTMMISPGLGSYTVLGELLLDIDVAPDAPTTGSRCGSCTACLDACPTQAFTAPFVLDARRCISYLTIEHRGDIPEALRPAFANRIFGCDRCQEVCPYNAMAPTRTPPDPEISSTDPRRAAPDLRWLSALGTNQRRKYVDGTALRRAHRESLLRNVCIALGNSGATDARAPLEALLEDRSELVRDHARWALGRLTIDGGG